MPQLSPEATAILGHLEAEHILLGRVLVKQRNQHRRTAYWKAFSRAHKITGSVISSVRTSPLQPSALQDASRRVLQLSHGVARHVTGAGFATLHAVLLAGIATYVSDISQLRDIISAIS